MVKKFKELVLTKDTVFEESIEVEGSIRCAGNNKFSLKVAGNIHAWNINAGNIDAGNIHAWNISAGNIDAWNISAWDIKAWDIKAWDINAGDINARNIDAWDIKAWDIICESRKKKTKESRTIARVFVQGRSKLERKEQMPTKSDGAK
jgi:hypothetical protein